MIMIEFDVKPYYLHEDPRFYITYATTVLHSSDDNGLDSRDGRREEVLAAPTDDPIGGQRDGPCRVSHIGPDDRTRGTCVGTDDRIETGRDVLACGESYKRSDHLLHDSYEPKIKFWLSAQLFKECLSERRRWKRG